MGEMRGTGRTKRMLARVKNGDVVIVHSQSFVPYAEGLLPEGVRPEWIVIQDQRDYWKLRGLDFKRVHVDHFVRETAGEKLRRWGINRP